MLFYRMSNFQLYTANFKFHFALRVDVDDFMASHVRVYPFSSSTINLQFELLAENVDGESKELTKQCAVMYM